MSISSSSRSCEIDEHGGAVGGERDQRLVDGGGGPGIDAPGRLRDHEHARVLQDLPADHEFLQVAARQAARQRVDAGRADVEFLDHLGAKSRALPRVDEAAGEQALRWRPLSTPLSARLISGTAAWPLRSSGTAHRPEPAPRRRPSWPTALPSIRIAVVGLAGALARQRQQQLVLAVAGDPGDAEDLAGADLEA